MIPHPHVPIFVPIIWEVMGALELELEGECTLLSFITVGVYLHSLFIYLSWSDDANSVWFTCSFEELLFHSLSIAALWEPFNTILEVISEEVPRPLVRLLMHTCKAWHEE